MTPEQVASLTATMQNKLTQPQVNARIVNGQYVVGNEPVKQRGKGGFLSSLISEAGGAGGAATGAAYGASVGSIIPGAGTLAGGILGGIAGGFLGGFGGKAVEQKVRDNQNLFGKGGSFKSALGEGALSGALGGAGEAFTGFRAASKAGIGLADALKTAPKDIQLAKAAVKSGNALRGGTRAVTDSLNLMPAAKAGTTTLSTADSKALMQHVTGISKSINPEQVLADLENHITTTGKQIGDLVASNNRALTKAEQTTVNSLTKNLAKQLPRGTAIPKDLVGVHNLRDKVIDELINFNTKSGSASAKSQLELKTAREELSNLVVDNVKGLAELNKPYSLSHQALPFIQKNVSKEAGIGLPVNLGPLGHVGITGRNASAVKAGAAQLRQGIAGLGGAPGSVGKQFEKQLIMRRAIGGRSQDPNIMQTNPDGSYQPANGAVNDTFDINDPSAMSAPQDALYGSMAGKTASNPTQTQQAPQSAYSYEQAIRDLNSTNNPKFQQQIMDRYDFIQKAEAAQKPASMIGKTSADTLKLAQQGMHALGQLNQLIQKDPNVILRTAVPGRGLPIVGGYVANKAGTGQYDTLGFAAVSSLLRAQSGAAVPDSEVRAYMMHYLPRAGDSPETIQTKLETLYFDFQSVLQGGNQSNLSLAIGGQ